MFNYILGDLPPNLFSESNGDAPNGGNAPSGKKGSGGKKGKGRPIPNSERLMQEKFYEKNKAVEFSVLCETTANLSKNLREMKAVKRKLFGEFTEEYC